jgi:hypothetical protein
LAHQRLTNLCFLGLAWLSACGMDPETDLPRGAELGSGAASATGGSGGSGGTTTQPPPETEVEESYTAPVVTGHWIWSANPLSGKVALINARTMDVTTADAGVAPTYVAAIGESTDTESAAIVLNVGNDTASVLYAVDGQIDVDSVKVHPGANRMTVSRSGRWAVVWSDATLVTRPDPTEGLQDVTVLDLAVNPVESYPLTVGYRPSRVTFGAGERHAYFVTEPGISVIDLPETDAPSVTRDIPVTTDPTEAASLRDVTVTPDGRVAIVRRTNNPTVHVVSLEDATDVSVTLPGPVTDLDLAPSGDVAFAVARNVSPSAGAGGAAGNGGSAGIVGDAGAGDGGQSGESGLGGQGGAEAGASNGGESANGGVSDSGSAGTGGAAVGQRGGDPGTGGTSGTGGSAGTSGSAGTGSTPQGPVSFVAVLPLAELFEDATAFTQVGIDTEVGSIAIAPDGDRALLYTNATPNDFLTIFDTQALEVIRTVDVQAPVRAVLASPDGLHAIAVLDKTPGSQKAGGFSLVPLTTTLAPKVIGTDAPPQAVALGENQGLVTVEGVDSKGTKVHQVYLAQLPGFGTKKVTLASPPLSAGLIVDEGLGFIAQSHPEGRITFLNLESGQPRTITGFELSSKVVQGE